jgi:hypothetical protein
MNEKEMRERLREGGRKRERERENVLWKRYFQNGGSKFPHPLYYSRDQPKAHKLANLS